MAIRKLASYTVRLIHVYIVNKYSNLGKHESTLKLCKNHLFTTQSVCPVWYMSSLKLYLCACYIMSPRLEIEVAYYEKQGGVLQKIAEMLVTAEDMPLSRTFMEALPEVLFIIIDNFSCGDLIIMGIPYIH